MVNAFASAPISSIPESWNSLTSPKGNELIKITHGQGLPISIVIDDLLPQASCNLQGDGRFLPLARRLEQLTFEEGCARDLVLVRARVDCPDVQRRIDRVTSAQSQSDIRKAPFSSMPGGSLTWLPRPVFGAGDARLSCARRSPCKGPCRPPSRAYDPVPVDGTRGSP